MAEKDLKANFDFAVKNKERLLKYYRDKFILVFEEAVVGSYDIMQERRRKEYVPMG